MSDPTLPDELPTHDNDGLKIYRGDKGKRIHLSVSAAASFDQEEDAEGCNTAWWYDKKEQRPREEKASTLMGKRIHQILELYLKTGEPPPEELADEDDDTTTFHTARYWRIASLGVDEMPKPWQDPSWNVERWIRHIAGPLRFVGKVDIDNISADTPTDEHSIDDHKTTKGGRKGPWSWTKTPEQLAVAPQPLAYAKVLYAQAGIPIPKKVQVRHNNYCHKGLGLFMQVNSWVTREDIEANWARLIRVAKAQVHILETCTSPKEVPHNKKACGNFGGCSHRAYCAHIVRVPEPPEHIDRENYVMSTTSTDAKARLRARINASKGGAASTPAPVETPAPRPAPPSAPDQYDMVRNVYASLSENTPAGAEAFKGLVMGCGLDWKTTLTELGLRVDGDFVVPAEAAEPAPPTQHEWVGMSMMSMVKMHGAANAAKAVRDQGLAFLHSYVVPGGTPVMSAEEVVAKFGSGDAQHVARAMVELEKPIEEVEVAAPPVVEETKAPPIEEVEVAAPPVVEEKDPELFGDDVAVRLIAKACADAGGTIGKAQRNTIIRSHAHPEIKRVKGTAIARMKAAAEAAGLALTFLEEGQVMYDPEPLEVDTLHPRAFAPDAPVEAVELEQQAPSTAAEAYVDLVHRLVTSQELYEDKCAEVERLAKGNKLLRAELDATKDELTNLTEHMEGDATVLRVSSMPVILVNASSAYASVSLDQWLQPYVDKIIDKGGLHPLVMAFDDGPKALANAILADEDLALPAFLEVEVAHYAYKHVMPLLQSFVSTGDAVLVRGQ